MYTNLEYRTSYDKMNFILGYFTVSFAKITISNSLASYFFRAVIINFISVLEFPDDYV